MKRGTENHPKTHKLASKLKINRAWACGILELVWAFTRDFCPLGDIGRFDNEAIARAALWPKDADAFVAELVDSEWLDESDQFRLVVHDWEEHCDEYTKKKVRRDGLQFASTSADSRKVQTSPENSGKFLPTRARLDLTIPNLTIPNLEPAEFFQKLVSRHPKKTAPAYAEREYAQVLMESQDVEATMQAIETSHVLWCRYWQDIGTQAQFLPKLMDWLKGGDWTQKPPADPGSEPQYPKGLM